MTKLADVGWRKLYRRERGFLRAIEPAVPMESNGCPERTPDGFVTLWSPELHRWLKRAKDVGVELFEVDALLSDPRNRLGRIYRRTPEAFVKLSAIWERTRASEQPAKDEAIVRMLDAAKYVPATQRELREASGLPWHGRTQELISLLVEVGVLVKTNGGLYELRVSDPDTALDLVRRAETDEVRPAERRKPILSRDEYVRLYGKREDMDKLSGVERDLISISDAELREFAESIEFEAAERLLRPASVPLWPVRHPDEVRRQRREHEAQAHWLDRALPRSSYAHRPSATERAAGEWQRYLYRTTEELRRIRAEAIERARPRTVDDICAEIITGEVGHDQSR